MPLDVPWLELVPFAFWSLECLKPFQCTFRLHLADHVASLVDGSDGAMSRDRAAFQLKLTVTFANCDDAINIMHVLHRTYML